MAIRRQVHGIPQARVVLGKHAPAWAATQRGSAEAPAGAVDGNGVTYARKADFNTMAILVGLWPLFAVTAMGIALLWTGTVYGTP
jgi:hypothetical protein